MGSIVAENRKNLMLFSGRAYPALANEIGEVLGIGVTETTAYDFAGGETFVRYTESVRGSDAFIVQSITAPVNKCIGLGKATCGCNGLQALPMKRLKPFA